MSKKQVFWCGDTREVVRSFPENVRRQVGLALHVAQQGGKAPSAKPMKSFVGTGVLEIAEPYAGDAYRDVYTVEFAEVICILSAFQKKSKRGIATPKHEISRVRQRLARAREMLAPREHQVRTNR